MHLPLNQVQIIMYGVLNFTDSATGGFYGQMEAEQTLVSI
jgi:hypothetical protein